MQKIKTLNSQQRRAVMHHKGPALVVAGAGTGKTAVISTRIAYLIKNRSVAPENILALTFTDKASAEMQQRVDELLPIGVVEVDILTFHALGDKILRDNAHDIGLPADFVVMSNFQQVLLMQQVLDGLRLSYYKPLSNPFSFVQDLLRFISKLKDEKINTTEFSKFIQSSCKKLSRSDKAEVLRLKDLDKIYCSYQETCKKEGMIDYGDQITLSIELLESKPSLQTYYQKKYQYILVDEFQDTNYSQSLLVDLLSKKHQNIMVVGDDDQSIYRFRGATISNILQFEKQHKHLKKIVLTKNYRSTQTILDCSYKLIQHNNPYRLETQIGISKKLKSSIAKKGEVKLLQFNSNLEEADGVAKKIASITKQNSLQFSEIAILIRKNNQAELFAKSLTKQGIPFEIAESQDLFEQSEIKLLVNFINCLNDPNKSVSLYGLLSSEIYQFTLAEIADISSKAAIAHRNLEEYILESGDKSLKQIVLNLHQYRLQGNDLTAGQLLYKFCNESGLLNQLITKAKKNAIAATKIQNISQFFAIVRDFERVERQNPNIFALWRYLNNIVSSESDITIQPSPLDLNAVSIMTVHKAKGLEFKVVFLVDLNQQTFPSVNRSDGIRVPEGLFSPRDDKVNWHTLEERRLFYVAMTRAKHKLFLTQSYAHGGKRLKKPSIFLKESLNSGILLSPSSSSVANLKQIETFKTLTTAKPDPIRKFYTKGTWLHLSTNQIADYLRSPLEFWYFNVLSLPKGPFHTLVYGSAIHAAIEVYYKAKILKTTTSLPELYRVYENSWKSEGFVSQTHELDRFKNGKQVLKNFYQSQQRLKYFAKYVEKPFILRLDQLKLEVSGRYDAIFETQEGVEIRDFKTGDIKDEKAAQKRLLDSIQMQVYGLAWQMTQSSPPKKLSLHFVEKDIIASTNKIDAVKTLKILKAVVDGVRSHQFNLKGNSRINFKRYL